MNIPRSGGDNENPASLTWTEIRFPVVEESEENTDDRADETLAGTPSSYDESLSRSLRGDFTQSRASSKKFRLILAHFESEESFQEDKPRLPRP